MGYTIDKCVKCGLFDPQSEHVADNRYQVVCGKCGFIMFGRGTSFKIVDDKITVY